MTLKSSKLTAMIAEDDPAMQRALAELLEGEGYQTTILKDGKEAFEALTSATNLFHLIITDYRMPNMTGTELIQKILSLNLPYKKIILLTAEELDHPDIVKLKRNLDGTKSIFVVSKGTGIDQLFSLVGSNSNEKTD